jgi:plastocyanin
LFLNRSERQPAFHRHHGPKEVHVKTVIPRVFLIVAALAVSGLVLVACGGDDDDIIVSDGQGAISTPRPANTPATGGGGGGGSGDQIVVIMKDNFFDPKEIEVPVGKKITFIARNEGVAVHNMRIMSKDAEGKDFVSKALVNPKTESKFEATFKKTGTYKFQCDYHVPEQVGTITVK